MPSFLIIGFFAAAAAIALFGTREMRRTKALRFAGRELQSDSEFFEAYYRDSGLNRTAVAEIRREVAGAIEVEPELLRPTDRFDFELAPLAGWKAWDDGLEILKDTGRWRTRFGRIDWSRIATLDDLIRLTAKNE